MSNPIRLTNRTAINLRKSAVRIKKTFFAMAVVMSVCMAMLAVYLGLRRLIAVPIVVMIAVALDTMIVIFGRSIYLSLLAQAICTEAAAREIRAGTSESQRRERALTDLINAKADVEMAQREKKKSASSAKKGAIKADQNKNAMRMNDTENTDSQNMRMETADENGAVPVRRRRRSDGLKIIRGEQAR